MKLKNALIVVSDIDKAKAFYKEIFGLRVVQEYEGKVILTEGIVLQERVIWEDHIKALVVQKHNAALLYFEETDIELFAERLDRYEPQIEYLNRLTTLSWGKKIMRFYDLDGNLIEVGKPVV